MAIAVTFFIHTMAEPIEGECPTCRFDALARITGHLLSEHGVTCTFDRITCLRCAAEERRGRAT